MWVTSWPYRNAIKALLLKSGSCSSPTMWNHCTVWARILVGLIFSRSLRVSQCFWDRPFVSTVLHHSPSFASFLQCCLLAFSRPPHPCLSPVLLVGFMDLCSTLAFIFSSGSCLGCTEWVYLSFTMWRNDLIIFSSEKQPSEFLFFTLVLCIYNACFKI